METIEVISLWCCRWEEAPEPDEKCGGGGGGSCRWARPQGQTGCSLPRPRAASNNLPSMEVKCWMEISHRLLHKLAVIAGLQVPGLHNSNTEMPQPPPLLLLSEGCLVEMPHFDQQEGITQSQQIQGWLERQRSARFIPLRGVLFKGCER